MALATLEKKIADWTTGGSLLAGTAAIGWAAASGNRSIMYASTGAYVLGGAAYVAGKLYDHAGQKIITWQTLRTSAKAVSIATAADVEQTASRLQKLEHAIDHRVDVITDSASPRGQVAMGAWVHAAKLVLEKAQFFDVAASPVDRDPIKLASNWPKVAQQLTGRVESYERMLVSESAKPVAETIYNFDYS